MTCIDYYHRFLAQHNGGVTVRCAFEAGWNACKYEMVEKEEEGKDDNF